MISPESITLLKELRGLQIKKAYKELEKHKKIALKLRPVARRKLRLRFLNLLRQVYEKINRGENSDEDLREAVKLRLIEVSQFGSPAERLRASEVYLENSRPNQDGAECTEYLGTYTSEPVEEMPHCRKGIGDDSHEKLWKKARKEWFSTSELARDANVSERVARRWCQALRPDYLEHNGKSGKASKYRKRKRPEMAAK